MYVQYKVSLSENQVDTLKEAIRLKKGATLCFPKVASGVIISCYSPQINLSGADALLLEMVSISTSMINVIKYIN